MSALANLAPHGLTVWYDASELVVGAPTSEVFCFEGCDDRDARVAELRALPYVCEVVSWDADPGYSLTTYYTPE
jgi:hypothetical protein